MSSTSDTIRQSPAPLILKPYAGDPDSRLRRAQRRWVIGLVVAFCLFYGLAFAFLAPFLLLAFAVPLAFLAALVVWALPDLNKAPTRTLETFYFTFLVALIMWPNYLALALPGLPWITMARLTGVPLALLFFICLSVSAGFRARLWGTVVGTPFIWRCLLLFVLVQIYTLAFSQYLLHSLDSVFTAQINWTTMFFISAYIFSIPSRAKKWAIYLWVISIILGLSALIEFKLHHVPWADHIPNFLKIEDPTVDAVMHGYTRAYTTEYKVQSTFTSPLALSEYMSLTVPFIIHFCVRDFSTLLRITAGISVIFVLYIIYLSGGRSGMIGFIISIMLYTLYWAILNWRHSKRGMLASAILFAYPAMGALVLTATIVIGRLRRVVWGGGETIGSTTARADQYKAGIPLILKHPFGSGMNRAAGIFRLSSSERGSDDRYVLSFYCSGLRYNWVRAVLWDVCFGRSLRGKIGTGR